MTIQARFQGVCRRMRADANKGSVAIEFAMTAGGSIVIAEIAYQYNSATSKVIGGPINFTNNFYAKPRRVAQLAAPTGGCP